MRKEKVKIIFFGTPKFAATILQSLIDSGFNIAAVFTQPDKKVGRKQKITYPAVKSMALKNEIEIFQPEILGEDEVKRKISQIGPDLFIVAAYGKILPQNILEIPRSGAINVHASLLPKYRGASPVQHAILKGEIETGITLMKMNEKMDEGEILDQEKIVIGKNETAEALLGKLSQLGAKIVVNFIPRWIKGSIQPTKQKQSQATYCKPIRREDGKVDWDQEAENIFRRWRAFYPWPGIYSLLIAKNQTKRLKMTEIGIIPDGETGEEPGKIVKYKQAITAQTKKGLVVLKKIQLEGKKEMSAEDLVRGFPEFIGMILK